MMTPIAWLFFWVAVVAIATHLYGLYVFKNTQSKGQEEDTPSGPKLSDFKVVGTYEFKGRLIDDTSVNIAIVLRMSDDGDREFVVVPERYEKDNFFKNGQCVEYVNAKLWEAGGPFPDGFEYTKDPLMEMLDRLVNQTITGIPDKDRHKIEDKNDD